MIKLLPCPECRQDDDLSIDSSRSMQISEVSCRACGYVFQSKCWEENIPKYWNKIPRSEPENSELKS